MKLYYRNGDKMMAVDIETEPDFAPSQPKLLFEGRFNAGRLAADYDVTAGRDLKDEYGLEEADKSRAGGASLRSLRQLLTELDPKQEWGGLRKLLTPEGHWLWLCEEHRDAYLQ